MDLEEQIILKEGIIYDSRKLYIIMLFSFLLLIPFAMAIDNYLNLKSCQSKPSNSCPSLYSPQQITSNAIELSANPSTGKIESSHKFLSPVN